MTSDNASALPVSRQLDAYNARDLDGFMTWWAPDCEYFAFPDRLLARGAVEIRARHAIRFQEPFLHAVLVGRLCIGDVVVDQEIVTRMFPDGPGDVDVTATYEVRDQRIVRAWFHQGTPRLHPSGTVRILPAAAMHASAVRDLTRAAYQSWVPLIGREPLPMAADHERAIRDHRVDLLFLDGALAGLIELVPEDGCLLIENVAVAPAWQRRGLGKQLLAHAEDVARTMGVERIRLYTNGAFGTNVRLYQHIGYTIDREEPFKSGTTVFMSKRLPRNP